MAKDCMEITTKVLDVTSPSPIQREASVLDIATQIKIRECENKPSRTQHFTETYAAKRNFILQNDLKLNVNQKNIAKGNTISINNNITPQSHNLVKENDILHTSGPNISQKNLADEVMLQNNIILKSNVSGKYLKEGTELQDYITPGFNITKANSLIQNNFTINAPVKFNPLIVKNSIIQNPIIASSPNFKSNLIVYVPVENNTNYQGKLLQYKPNVRRTLLAVPQLSTKVSTIETDDKSTHVCKENSFTAFNPHVKTFAILQEPMENIAVPKVAMAHKTTPDNNSIKNTVIASNNFILQPTSGISNENTKNYAEEEDPTMQEINEILSDIISENTVKENNDMENNSKKNYPNTQIYLNLVEEFNNFPKETPCIIKNAIADNNEVLDYKSPEENLDFNQNFNNNSNAQDNQNMEYNSITDNEKNSSVVSTINNFEKAVNSPIMKGFDLDLNMPTPLMEEILFDNEYSILSDTITNEIYNTQLENHNIFNKHDTNLQNNSDREKSQFTSMSREFINIETVTHAQESALIKSQTQEYRTESELDIGGKRSQTVANEIINLSMANVENKIGFTKEEETKKIKGNIRTGKISKDLNSITEGLKTELTFIEGKHSEKSVNIKEITNSTNSITVSKENQMNVTFNILDVPIRKGSNVNMYELEKVIEPFPITEVNHTHIPFNEATGDGFVEFNPIASYDLKPKLMPKFKQMTENDEILDLNISEFNKITAKNRVEDVSHIIVYNTITHENEFNHILPIVNTNTSENEIAGLNPIIEYNEKPTHFIENLDSILDYNEANDGEKQMNLSKENLSDDLQLILNQFSEFDNKSKRAQLEKKNYKKNKINKLKLTNQLTSEHKSRSKKQSVSVDKLKKSSCKVQKRKSKVKIDSSDTKDRSDKNSKKSKNKSKRKSKKSRKRKHSGKNGGESNKKRKRNAEHDIEKRNIEMHRDFLEKVTIDIQDNGKSTVDNKGLPEDNGKHNMEGKPERLSGRKKKEKNTEGIKKNAEETSDKKKNKKRLKREKIEECKKDLDDDKGEVRRPFRCHICLARFTRHYNLNEHLTRHTEKMFICTTCKEPFSCVRYLSRHVKKHGKKFPYKCNECDQEYETYKQYSQHQQFHKRAFKCHCGLIFNSKSLKIVHERSHLGQNSFYCRVCARGFNDQTDYKQHELLCSSIKNYCQVCDAYTHEIDKCPVCDTPFSVKNLMDKPFKCTLCERQYMSKARLTRHKLDTHKGMMRFKCKYCGFKSSDRGNFIAHKRLHTDDRPFACSYCPKRFTHGPTLTKHLRLHTGVSPFICKFCQKRFKLEIDLQKHEDLHVKIIGNPLIRK